MKPKTKTYRIYSCEKHPNWTLETAAPEIKGALQVMCPFCREEFIIRMIGLPEMRTEEREIKDDKKPEQPESAPGLF